MKEQNITIKTSWDEITIQEFYDIQNAITKYQDKETNELIDLEVNISLLSILSGEPVETFESMSMPQLNNLLKRIKFIYNNVEDIKGEIRDVYVVGNRHYKLIKNVTEINAGQFIDLQHFTKSGNPLDILSNTHLICSTLLLPIIEVKKSLFGPDKIITEKYGETPFEETWDNILNNMKITDALGISVFFYLLYIAFQKTIQTYSEQKLKKMIPQLLKTLRSREMKKRLGSMNSGDGLNPLIESLEEIEQNGIMSLK